VTTAKGERARSHGGWLLAAAAIGALTMMHRGPLLMLVSALLAVAMTHVALVDRLSFRIPDAVSLPAVPAGLLVSGPLLNPGLPMLIDPWHVAGAVLGGGLFYAIRAGHAALRGAVGLGLGDVKLAAAGGAWVGLDGLGNVVLLAAVAALAGVLILSRWRGRPVGAATRVPFGLFLAPAIWIVWAAQVLTL
jgi:leader peptidase (prepilin peptidase) / N-methyltransferase